MCLNFRTGEVTQAQASLQVDPKCGFSYQRTKEVPLLKEGPASLRKGLHRAGGIPRPASPLRPR